MLYKKARKLPTKLSKFCGEKSGFSTGSRAARTAVHAKRATAWHAATCVRGGLINVAEGVCVRTWTPWRRVAPAS